MLCDEVILLNRGRVVKQDTLKNIKDLFKADRVEIQLTYGITEQQLADISSIQFVKEAKVDDRYLLVSYEKENMHPNELLKKLVRLNVEMDSFNPVQLSLETYYLKEIKEENK